MTSTAAPRSVLRAGEKNDISAAMPWRCGFEEPAVNTGALKRSGLCDPSAEAAAIHAARAKLKRPADFLSAHQNMHLSTSMEELSHRLNPALPTIPPGATIGFRRQGNRIKAVRPGQELSHRCERRLLAPVVNWEAISQRAIISPRPGATNPRLRRFWALSVEKISAFWAGQ